MYFVDVFLNKGTAFMETAPKAGCRPPERAKTAGTLTNAADSTVISFDAENPRHVLEKLESLLRQGNSSCLNLLGDLRAVPGSEELICEMESFYFGSALVILDELRGEIEKEDVLWITGEKTAS